MGINPKPYPRLECNRMLPAQGSPLPRVPLTPWAQRQGERRPLSRLAKRRLPQVRPPPLPLPLRLRLNLKGSHNPLPLAHKCPWCPRRLYPRVRSPLAFSQSPQPQPRFSRQAYPRLQMVLFEMHRVSLD